MAETDKIKKAAEIVAAGGIGITPLRPGTDETGDEVQQKNPMVELRRDTIMMALGIPPFEGVIAQVTNFDHPIQPLMVIKDLTELEFMRSLGLPASIYAALKGESFLGEDGKVNIRLSGFTGILRGRQGMVYPGDAGFDFHTKTQILNPQPKSIAEKNKDKSWLARLNPFGGGSGD